MGYPSLVDGRGDGDNDDDDGGDADDDGEDGFSKTSVSERF
jgi:hypothetical protein